MNCTRHAYVNFTGKPYIYYNGVTYDKTSDQFGTNSNDKLNRTSIRTILPNKTFSTQVPLNGFDNLANMKNQNNSPINLRMAPASCNDCY